jgi:hypothetical protein
MLLRNQEDATMQKQRPTPDAPPSSEQAVSSRGRDDDPLRFRRPPQEAQAGQNDETRDEGNAWDEDPDQPLAFGV